MSSQNRTVPVIVMPLSNTSPRALATTVGGAGFETLEQRVLMAGQPTAADNSIAYDAAGSLHVAYYDSAEKSLKYTTQSLSGAWSDPTVVDATSSDVGKMVSLAINPAGHPGIAYFDSANADLRYAYNDGTSWKTVAVDTKGSVGQNPSLAFDASGNAIISYYRASSGDLRLAVLKSLAKNKWTLSTVAKKGDVGEFSSLAINPTTRQPIIAFTDSTGKISYANKKSGGFSKPVVVDDLPVAGTNVDVVLGSNGRPAVSYFDPSTGSIKLAQSADSKNKTFGSEVIASVPAGSNPNPTLLIDPTTHLPQVVYYDSDANAVYVAKKSTGGATQTQEIKSGGGEGFTAAIQPGNGSISFAVVSGGGSGSPVDLGNTDSTPLPPTNVAANANGATEVDLTWSDAATNETGYLIERSTDGVTFSTVAQLAPNLTSYADTSASEATTYYYRVSATGGAGSAVVGTAGDLNSGLSFVTATTAPLAATGLAATGISDTQIALSWIDHSSAETGYRIERSSPNSGVWTTLEVLGANSTSYSDSTVTEGASYQYRVFAVVGSMSSAASNVIAATSAAAAPSGLTVTQVTTTSLTLTWTNNARAATGLVLQRSTDGLSFTGIATLPAGQTTYNDTSLSEGRPYYYRVKAVAAPSSIYSNVANATTNPQAPSNLTASPLSSTRIDLTWTDNTSNETGYLIQRSIAGGDFATVGTVGANVTTYADTGRTEGTLYSYRVRATIAGSADSAYSPVVASTTLPSAPTALVATLSGNGMSVSLAWADNATGESGYQVQRQTAGSSTWTTLATTAANSVGYTDSTAAEGTSYTYRVRAVNAYGLSAFGNSSTATTVPAAPSGASATANSTTAITIQWTDNSAGATGFIIERSSDGVNFTSAGTVGAGVQTFQDTSVTAGQSFTYRIKATDAGGTSAASGAIAGTSLSDAPTALQASPVSATQIGLSWSGSTGAASYRIERSDDGATWSTQSEVSGTTYNDLVVEGHAYTYRIRTINAGGVSAASDTAAVTSLPAAPTALVSTATDPTTVVLSWTDHSAGETGFDIDRSTDGTTFAPLASVGADVTSYTDGTAAEVSSYVYRVRATDSGGASAYATGSSVGTPPNAPTGVSAVATSATTTTITWTDASSGETGYRIERSGDAGGTFTLVTTTAANAASATDTGLTANTPYIYRVTATSATGNSASVDSSVTTVTLPPANFTAATNSTTSVTLAWIAPAGATGFVLERSTDNVTFAAVTEPLASDVAYTDTTLTEATGYYYRLQAINAGGGSSYAVATVVTQPNMPLDVTATATSATAATVSWSDASNNEDGYSVEVSTDGGASYSVGGSVGSGVTTTSVAVPEGVSPMFRVRAITSGVYSDYSATATADTFPAAPSALQVQSLSTSSLRLDWTDNSDHETGFRIERSSGGSGFVEVGTVSADVTQWYDSNLTEATAYTYRLRATMGSARNSDYSDPQSGTTRPETPSGLSATLVDGGVQVVWQDNSTGSNSFTLERTADLGDNWTLVSDSATSGYTDTTTSPGLTYNYRVRAVGSGGVSGNSDPAEATLIPAAPTGVTATAVANENTVNVTWNDVAGETGYNVYRSDGGATAVLLGSIASDVTSYADHSVIENGSYAYSVSASNASGESDPSAAAPVNTTLIAPTLVQSTATTTSVTVTWQDNSSGEADFLVQRLATNGVSWVDAGTASANAQTFTDSAVQQGTSYTYRVIARNGSVVSSPSASTSVVTGLATPTALVASSISASRIDLSWTDNAQNHTGFQIYRSTDGVQFSQIDFVAVGATAYSDTALEEATTYYYEISAANTVTTSAYSSPANAVTRPAAPTSLQVTSATTSAVTLTWTDASAGETDYKVQRSTDGGSAWSDLALTGDAAAYTDSTVSEGVPYSYRLAAVNSAGLSSYATVSVTTAPTAITGLTAIASGPNSAALAWTNHSTHATSIVVQRAPSGGAWSDVATLSASATSYQSTGLDDAQAYDYRVLASLTQRSVASNTASVTTPPLAATSVAASAISDTSVHIVWADNSTRESGYRVERAPHNGAFIAVATIAADSTSYDDTTAAEGTNYDYRIVAIKDSAETQSATSTTQTKPAAPSALVTTSPTAGAIHLAWADNSAHETAFVIERSDDNVTFTTLTSVAANATSYDDTTVAAGSTYYYRLHAVEGSSSTSTASTAGLSRLAAVTGVTAGQTGSSSAHVTWTGVSGASGYLVERSSDGGGSYTTAGTVSVTAFDDSALSESTAYTYRVSAINASGNGTPSATAAARTLPNAPTDLSLTAVSPTEIDLAWSDHSSSATAYHVYRSTSGAAFVEIVNNLANNAAGYSDTTVSGGTHYAYEIVADDGVNLSAPTSVQEVTTVPAAVTSLSGVSNTATTTNLTWSDSTGATSYLVERSINGTTFASLGTVTTNSYADAAATEGTLYTYRVTPSGLGGAGPGATTTVTTLPASATALSVTSYTDTSVSLGWTDVSNGETGYKVARSIDGISWTDLSTTAANATTYVDSTASEGTAYLYRVTPTDAGGDGVGIQASVITRPTAASGVSAAGVSATSVHVTWTDNSNHETGYSLLRSDDNGSTYVTLASSVAAGTVSYDDNAAAAGTALKYKIVANGAGGASADSNVADVTTVPAAVADLAAAGVSTTEVGLTWTDVSGNTSYTLERSDSGGAFAVVDNAIGADATSYSDTTVVEGTLYAYRLTAVNAGGSSDASNIPSVTTVPAAPTLMTASPTNATTVHLTWQDNSSGETNVEVQRFDGVSWSTLTTLAANAVSYDDTVASGTTYSYRVRMHNAGGDSAFTGTASATTVPAAPTATATVNGTSEADLTWATVSGATGYRVYRSDDGGSTFAQVGSDLSSVTLIYNDSSLTEATPYTYHVVAFNATGEGAASAGQPVVTRPNTPDSLASSGLTTTSLTVSWTDESAGEDGYQIQRSVDGGGTWSDVDSGTAAVSGTGSSDSIADSGLSEGTHYLYRVRATVGAQTSDWGSSYAVDTDPATPASLTVSSFTDTSASLLWADSSAGEDGYKVERADNGGAYSVVQTLGANVTTWADTSLAESNDYSYRVRAYKGTSYSGYSSGATVTTHPTAPTGLAVAANSETSTTLTWTDNSSTEDGYYVERSTDGTTWSQIADIAADSNSYDDNAAPESATTYYRVQAYKAAAVSAYTDAIPVTTPVAAPSSLVATATSDTSVDLNWSVNSGVPTAEVVQRSADNGSTWSSLATLGAGATGYTDATATENSAYRYRVITMVNLAASPASNIQTLLTPLSAPTGLAATSPTATSVALTWTNHSSAATNTVIERYDGSWSTLTTVSSSLSTYTDSTVSEGADYQYRIHATKAGNASATTLPAAITTIPAAPTSLSLAVFSNTEIDLSWSDNSSHETGYEIDRSEDGVTFAPVATTAADATSYSDTGVHEGGTFSYLVYAIGAGGNSAQAASSAITAPADPTGFTATPTTATQVDLAWTDNSNGETSYTVQKSTDGGSTYSTLATLAPNVHVYSDTSVGEASTPYYRVRAARTTALSAWVVAHTTTVPAAPTTLAALVPAGSPRVTLSWVDQSAGESGYEIERSLDGSSWSTVITTAANATSFSDNTVTEGTTYHYRVRAASGAGPSLYSNQVVASTLPATPTALAASVPSYTHVDLTWTDNSSSETGYNVERSVGGVTWSVLTTLPANSVSYSDTAVSEAVTYQYRVRALTAAANGNPSASATAVTPLAAPSGMSAVPVSTTQVNLTWTDNSAAETNFKIERSTDSGASWTTITTVAANTQSYNDATASAGTTYLYRVKATKSSLSSTYATSASVTTVPASPGSVTASAVSGTQVNLTWTDTSGETNYTVERSGDAGSTWSVLSSTIAANSISYSDTTAAENTAYLYRVKATNAAGGSSYATSSPVTTLPSAPDGLSSTVLASDTIQLSWTDHSNAETGFRIERRLTGGTWAEITTVSANVTMYVDPTLDESTGYEYRVRATVGGRNSVYSNTSGATTLPVAPDTLNAAGTTSSTVSLTWNNTSAAQSILIERSSDGGDTFATIGTVGTGSTSYTDSSVALVEGTTYAYRVRASNGAGGFSDYSNAVFAVTLPAAPTSLHTTTVTSSLVSLTWTENSNGETGVAVQRSAHGTNAWTDIATLEPGAASQNDAAVATGNDWDYRVRSFNDGGSTYSNTVRVQVP